MMNDSIVEWEFLQFTAKGASGTAPIPCFLHSMTQIGSKLLLFGGCNYDGEPQSQLFVFDTRVFAWSKLKIAEDTELDCMPGVRYGHSATVVDMHPLKIMVYGGLVGGSSFNFDEEDNMLQSGNIEHAESVADIDSDGDGEESALDTGMKRNFQLGKGKGKKCEGAEEFDDSVYFLTLNKTVWEWSKPLVVVEQPAANSVGSSRRPSARTEHSVAKVSTNVVAIFGGWTCEGRPSNDLWMLDYQNLEWSNKPTSGIQPRPRFRHTCEVIGRRMWVLGGSDNGDDNPSRASPNVMSGISELNLDTMVWSHPNLKGANPFPRSGHTSVVVGTNNIAIFGGRYHGEMYYNDLFLINMETYTSVLINAITTKLPTPIANASLNCVQNTLYCFGGTDVSGGAYNDVRRVDIAEYLASKDIHVGVSAVSDYSFKILVIGDASVGKSCILTRFSENKFVETTATLGIDFNSRQIKVDGSVCKLEIWDTAGQERFSQITASYYRNAQGALLVYDIGLAESFQNIRKWFERARQLGGEHIEAVLVGNKNDIPPEQRQVSTEQGMNLAREMSVPFIETSAKDGSNVDEAFVRMSKSVKCSVDKRGLAGVASDSIVQSGGVKVGKGDRAVNRCC